ADELTKYVFRGSTLCQVASGRGIRCSLMSAAVEKMTAQKEKRFVTHLAKAWAAICPATARSDSLHEEDKAVMT
ncbi:MAG TPA: hypothetical protein VGE39_15000, partial [Prosthecobacter sp.]